MKDPLEYDIYSPVNISHPSYLVSFASYFCGSASFSKFILIKMPGALIFIVTLPNLISSAIHIESKTLIEEVLYEGPSRIRYL